MELHTQIQQQISSTWQWKDQMEDKEKHLSTNIYARPQVEI